MKFTIQSIYIGRQVEGIQNKLSDLLDYLEENEIKYDVKFSKS